MGSTTMLMGTALSSGAKIYGGYAQNAAMQGAAGQLQQEAGQSVASGIQGAIEANRRADYVGSNAQARIAAGGLTTTGRSAVVTLGRIAGQGEYNARTALYQGYDRAQELDFRAQTMRNEGSAAETAGWIGGASSALSGYQRVLTMHPSSPLYGTQSFYSKYGAYDSSASGPG